MSEDTDPVAPALQAGALGLPAQGNELADITPAIHGCATHSHQAV